MSDAARREELWVLLQVMIEVRKVERQHDRAVRRMSHHILVRPTLAGPVDEAVRTLDASLNSLQAMLAPFDPEDVVACRAYLLGVEQRRKAKEE